MSYNPQRKRGGGPNRGGGRGRGRGRGRGGGGRGGGGPPSGLSGKAIGMYYKNKGQEKKQEREKNERAVVTISGEAQQNISRILNDVRLESLTDGHHVEQQQQGHSSSWFSDPAPGSATPGPSSSWGSEGACGVGQPTGQAASGSHPHLPMGGLQRLHQWGGGGGETGRLDSEKLERLSRDMKAELHRRRQTNTKYQKMMEFRQKLPSWEKQEEILELIRENQVVVLSGETGCGKTTQVPQFILEDAVERGFGAQIQIICTQPRRISAISVAKRVAEERGERLGGSVGFQIRLENQLPDQRGSILYCTTGILLRRMINDSLLREVSHVVLDEVHERSVQSDFLIIVLRDILPHRPDLKVILMSATLNAELFSQYFGGVPMYNIPSVVFPVARYFLEDVLQMTRFCPPPPTRRGPPSWVRHLRGQAEAMEKKRTEEQERAEYIASLEAKRTYPPYVVEALRNMDGDQVPLELMLELVKTICREGELGAILVFLPGWDTISKLHDMLKSDPVFRSRNYLIIPLHSLMPTSFQQSVLPDTPAGEYEWCPPHLAETSLTIDAWLGLCHRLRGEGRRKRMMCD
ncbi:ATP-dependent DNA/RNA helicase DHX36 [Geodia barretti]|uniref:RNA helicase n=1 Tax=Geodia barretti TaxID=519541 RepID=A0AA35TFE9_GEOBA|nr:ATP-dependent DNA/RNA helicase DHX36 [Geodia barretti]